MEPLGSVIIPVYNVLPYLREALDSIINQTYKNLEVLVVDDGSTDGSGEVCDEYRSDPRVIVIHQENKGLSGARNTGLDRMTGEYVAFLDSDDAFMPEMVEKMLKALSHTEAQIAICKYIVCSTSKPMKMENAFNESLLFSTEQIISSANALNIMIHGKTGWYVWNKIYHRSTWNGVHFPEGDNYEDMRVMCQVIGHCNEIVAMSDTLVFYRKRAGSITNLHNEKNMHDYLLAIFSIEEYIQKHLYTVFSKENVLTFQEFYARILSNRYARLLFHSHSAKSIEKFRNEIQIRWKQLEGVSCQIQSRITRFLFLYAPVLLIPAQFCWRFWKNIFRKAHA